MIVFFQIFISIIVGAVIGYVTNYIAIKMLFRPYRKYYIFNKIPVPLTPGIIPKHREKMAEKFGGVVGNVFLNEETFKSKISESNTKEIIEQTIEIYIDKALEYEFDTVYSLIPDNHKDKFDNLLIEGKSIITDYVDNYLHSDSFSQNIKSLIEKEFDIISQTKIKNLLDNEKFEEIINDILEDVLNNKELHDRILDNIEEYIDSLFHENKTLDEFLPEGTINLILIASIRVSYKLLPVFGKLLNNEELKSLLSDKIKDILYQLISELNAFQKVIINMIQLKGIINKEVPNLVDRFILQLEVNFQEKQTRKNINKIIKNYLNDIRNKKVSELFKEIDKERYQKIKHNTKKAIRDLINNKEIIKSSISKYIKTFADSVSERTIKDFLIEYSEDFHDNVKDILSDNLIKFAQSSRITETIKVFIDENIDYVVYKMKVGKLNNYFSLNNEKKEEIILFITDSFINLLIEQTPSILNAIKIQQMIKDKMNSFSTKEMEEVIVSVVKSELRYINIFGALLGGMIGSINFILNMIMSYLF